MNGSLQILFSPWYPFTSWFKDNNVEDAKYQLITTHNMRQVRYMYPTKNKSVCIVANVAIATVTTTSACFKSCQNISLIEKKSTGPRIEPWGSPQVKPSQVDVTAQPEFKCLGNLSSASAFFVHLNWCAVEVNTVTLSLYWLDHTCYLLCKHWNSDVHACGWARPATVYGILCKQ